MMISTIHVFFSESPQNKFSKKKNLVVIDEDEGINNKKYFYVY